jgi:hypothetical protein
MNPFLRQSGTELRRPALLSLVAKPSHEWIDVTATPVNALASEKPRISSELEEMMNAIQEKGSEKPFQQSSPEWKKQVEVDALAARLLKFL